MLNHIVVMGRLTRDPELRRTQSGVSVTSFSVAVDRDVKNTLTGERETDFIDVVAWRSTAEFVTKYFSKGKMAVVEGRLQLRDWTDREGQKRRSAEIVADRVYFGESRRDSDYNSPPPYGAPASGGYATAGYGTPPNGYGGSGGGYTPPAYNGAPAAGSGYTPPAYGGAGDSHSAYTTPETNPQSDFAGLDDEDDGDLPF